MSIEINKNKAIGAIHCYSLNWVTGEANYPFYFGSVLPCDAIGYSYSISSGQPLLEGASSDFLLLQDADVKQMDGIQYLENELFMGGSLQIPVVSLDLEDKTYQAYQKIIQLIAGRYCFRIWNYVPAINAENFPHIENYRLFCSGRSRAFFECYGDASIQQFSSASATGCEDNCLTVAFLASKLPVKHWENPEQTPAYLYPDDYGPRAPSFSRASSLKMESGDEWVFISGTAAIKRSETQYRGNFTSQLEVTLSNIDLTLNQAGYSLKSCEKIRMRHFKIYLKDPSNLPVLKKRLQSLLLETDTYSVVKADICRSDLEVEIELSILAEN